MVLGIVSALEMRGVTGRDGWPQKCLGNATRAFEIQIFNNQLMNVPFPTVSLCAADGGTYVGQFNISESMQNHNRWLLERAVSVYSSIE